MKKTVTKIFSLLLALAMLTCMLASCGGEELVSNTGTAKIVVEHSDGTYAVFEADLSKLEKNDEGAVSVLEYIASQENSTLYFNLQWGGGYGAYITAIDTLSPDVSNQYIAIYTSEEKDFAVPSEWSPTVATVKYGDKTLTYSGVGLSSMHINDGTVILFRIEGF